MLYLTKYYKGLLLGVIKNNFAGVENKSVLDDFSMASDKSSFIKSNGDELISLIKNLSQDNILSYGDGEDVIEKRNAILDVFNLLGIEGKDLATGVDISLLEKGLQDYLEVLEDNQKGKDKIISETSNNLDNTKKEINPQKSRLEMAVEESYDRFNNTDKEVSHQSYRESSGNEVYYSGNEEIKNIFDTNKFTRTLKRGVSNGDDIGELQKFLILKGFLKSNYKKEGKEISNIDNNFGGRTENALKEYQKSIGTNNIDGILSFSKKKEFATLKSIKNAANEVNLKINKENFLYDTLDSSEKADASIRGLTALLKNSKEFYESLETILDGGEREAFFSRRGSLWGWLLEAFGRNKANKEFEKIKKFENKIENENLEEKFNEGFDYLIEYYTNESGDSGYYEDSDGERLRNSLFKYGARDIIILLLAGIPIIDVRLNFMKSLVSSSVLMDKAYQFSKWVEGGMEKSYEDYDNNEGKEINTGKETLQNLEELKGTITYYLSRTYGEKILEDGNIEELIIKLSKTDKNISNLISTYIEYRFIPDSETLLLGGFEWIEDIFDDKPEKIEELLNKLHGNKQKIGTYTFENEDWEDYDSELFLLKNDGKYYLEIDGEYREFSKNPTKEEIDISIDDYRKPGKPGWIEKELNSEKSEKLNILSSKEKLQISYDIINIFKEQDEEGWGWFNEGIAEGTINHVENRTDFMEEINEKSSFLKGFITILEKEDNVSNKKLAHTFGILKTYNSIDDFLEAYEIPKEIKDKISGLKGSEGNIDSFINTLTKLNKDKDITNFFNSLKSYENRVKYRLETFDKVDATIPLDTKKFKHGAYMLTKRQFNLTNQQISLELKSEYKSNPKSSRVFKDFKSFYGFEKPETYDIYLNNLLTQTGPEMKDAEGLATISLLERGLIEMGILEVSGKELLASIQNGGLESIDINKFDQEKNIINTARQKGTQHDKITNFNKLIARGDTHVFHTTVTESYNLTTKSGGSVKQFIKYDIYLRPECQNILILPDAKTVEQIQHNPEFDMNVSLLNTPTLPAWIVGEGLLNRSSGGENNPDQPNQPDPNIPDGGTTPITTPNPPPSIVPGSQTVPIASPIAPPPVAPPQILTSTPSAPTTSNNFF